MKKILFILLSFIALNVQGQYPQQAAPNTHTISGKIMDGDSNIPMEYCTVSLFNTEDNSLVSGNVTDTKGNFLISGQITAGEYYIEASFIGFSPVKTASFSLNKENISHNVGTIILQTDAELVDEVEVTAIRSSVKYELDKKVINVDKQIAASNGNAVDVLASVPSVQVDIDGGVKLRGSGGFQVLINGRPSILSGSDALQQIPASQIKNIEIITNPSAKYDAEGDAGIINIILKEEGNSGFSGVVNARAGLWKNYGGDITMSYNTKKWTYTLAGDFNNRNMPTDMIEKRNTFSDSTDLYQSSEGDKAWRFQNYGLKAGAEFRPNQKNTISFQGHWRNWYMFVDDELDIENIDKIANTSEVYQNINDTKRGGPSYRATVDYNLAMDNNSNLTIHGAFNRNFFDEEVLNFRSENDIYTGGSKSSENGGGFRLRLNIDYDITIGENAKFELGAVQQIRHNSEDIKSFTYDASADNYINLSEFNRTVETTRNMRAFYGIHSNKWNKIAYQLGVRAENTYREIEVEAYNSQTDVKRLDLFPSAHVSYNLNERNQLMTSYAKRIERPRPWFLQPSQIFLDPNTIFEGTPDILPTYTHNVELGWINTFKKKGSFSAEAYYRRELNIMEFTILPYEDNIVRMQPINVGDGHVIGLESKLNFSPIKWWDIDITGNMYQYIIEGKDGNENFDNESFVWSTRINNYFLVSKTTKFQIEAMYQSKDGFSQGERSPYYTLNAGFRQTFMKNAFTLAVQARNITGSGINENNRVQDNLIIYDKRTPKWPQLSVSLSYRINNYRPKRSKYYDEGDY